MNYKKYLTKIQQIYKVNKQEFPVWHSRNKSD